MNSEDARPGEAIYRLDNPVLVGVQFILAVIALFALVQGTPAGAAIAVLSGITLVAFTKYTQ